MNPYTPGAGSTPFYLAGRNNLLDEAQSNIENVIGGGASFHTIYYGVRGVGKTVLLNEIESMVNNCNYYYIHFECDEHFNFIKNIIISIKKILIQLSTSAFTKNLLANLKNFIKSFELTYTVDGQTFATSYNSSFTDIDMATGDLETDLISLFSEIGNILLTYNKVLCFFVDEMQNMNKEHLVIFIKAIHRMNQLNMPIIVFGAGLPTILRICGDACSYSERLFNFVEVSYLTEEFATDALVVPAKNNGVEYTREAITFILENTGCYPYFIQQYGKIIWQYIVENKLITIDMVEAAYTEYLDKLDYSFFGTRFSRSTKAEKNFLYAMAKCSTPPYAITDVANQLNKQLKSISPMRNNLINKGLIYSPSFGEVDFTVPQFDLYLKRLNPNLTIE